MYYPGYKPTSQDTSDIRGPGAIQSVNYTEWLMSQEERFKNEGKWEYFDYVNGRLVFNPEKARQNEFYNWKSESRERSEREKSKSEWERDWQIEQEKRRTGQSTNSDSFTDWWEKWKRQRSIPGARPTYNQNMPPAWS